MSHGRQQLAGSRAAPNFGVRRQRRMGCPMSPVLRCSYCIIAGVGLAVVAGCSDRSELAQAKADAEKARVELAEYKALLAEPLAYGKTIPELRKDLLGPDDKAAVQAAKGLEQIGPRAKVVVPDLIQCLRHENMNVRVASTKALGGIGESEQTVPALLAHFANEDIPLPWKEEIAISLGRIGPGAKAAIPALMQFLNELLPGSRGPVIKAIRNIEPGVLP